MRSSSDRRKSSRLTAYLFFLFEVVMVLEFSYIYTSMFGTTTIAIIPLLLISIYILNSSVKRLLRVIQRINFINYDFTSNRQKI